jgi:hypothetical protein
LYRYAAVFKARGDANTDEEEGAKEEGAGGAGDPMVLG